MEEILQMTDSTSGTLRSYGIADPTDFGLLAPTISMFFSRSCVYLNWSSRFRYSTSCMFWYIYIIYKLQFTSIYTTFNLKPHFLCKCFLLNGYHSAWTRSARKHVERIDLHELNSKPLQSMAVATLMISIPQNTIDHDRSYVKGVRKIPKMETR